MKTFPAFNGAKADGRPWFTVKNEAAADSAEILIYEQIGKDWWSGEGIGAKDFIAEVNKIPQGRKITMRINSNGGNVHDGLAILNYMQARKKDVTCIVDGVAASIASIIALCGKELHMPRNALLMIHDPWSWVQGSADDMRKAADALDTHKDSLISVYEGKTGKTREEISTAMSAETWFTGDEAKAFGLCDCVTDALPAMACSNLDFSNFRRVPESLKAPRPQQPAALSGEPNPKDTMNKEKIIALLKQKGIEVPKDATEEQLMNLLTGAVNNSNPNPAPAPANTDVNAALAEELKQIRAERESQKRASIKAALVTCGNEGRIPLNSVDGWVESCMKDESLLAKVQAMEPKLPGVEPVAVNVEITSEAPEAFNAAFEKFAGPARALARNKTGNMQAIKDAALARACFIAKNGKRLGEILNTNTVATELKRQVILQDGIRAFRRRLIALRAFCTVFESVPLEGTDKVVVPYHALQSVASTAWNQDNGYVAGDTADSFKEITIDQRYYQGFDFSSQTLRRQPYFDYQQHMVLKAEKLALDVVQAAMAKITAASYGDAVVTSPADAFDRDDVATLRGAANTANWPEMGRSLFLATDFDTALFKDAKLTDADKSGTNAALTGIIRNILGFDYMGGNNYIPGNSENLSGFIAWKSALLFATAPILPAPAVLAQLESYNVVIDEQTGVAFEYRSFGSAQADEESHFVECNYGAVAGEEAALKRITSA